MKSFLRTIVEARELISDPAHWCQGYFAKDAEGHVCDWWHKDAVCFCAEGALRWANESTVFSGEEINLFTEAFGGSVPYMNDHNSHEDVLAGFDRLIVLAREAEVL